MKKNIKIYSIVLFLILYFNKTNAQLKTWYFAQEKVRMDVLSPVAVPLSFTGGNNGSANGMYQSGIPDQTQFNISQLLVYNKAHANVGSIYGQIAFDTPEIAIVPFPDNDGCTKNKYYVFNSSPTNNFRSELKYYVVDMNGNGCDGDFTSLSTLVTGGPGASGGIAVSKLSGGNRFIYFCSGYTAATIYKATITPSGISVPQNIYQDNTGTFNFETSELDLSPDGSMLVLAANGITGGVGSASPRYYIIGLNTSGDWNGVPPSTFDLAVNPDPTIGGRGVEFYTDNLGVTKLMIGAGANGIYRINPANPMLGQTFINGTINYGSSQLEVAPNGFLYASNSQNTIAIDVQTFNTPFVNNSANITTPSSSYIDDGFGVAPRFYTLPDQIDGEDLEPFLRSACLPIDLFIRDNDVIPNHYDTGEEPNQDQGEMWISKDIYIHQTNTNPGTQSDEPVLPNTQAYVYVLIHNRGCQTYNFNSMDQVHLYWSKASTALEWPDYWNITSGQTVCSGAPAGMELPSSPRNLPTTPIPPGGQAWVEFPWTVPDPAPYSCFGNEWLHFCLLARLEAPSIGDIIGPEVPHLYTNVQNYNNEAWKNITLVSINPFSAGDGACINDKEVGGTVGVGNSTDKDGVFRLDFKVDDSYTGKPIFEQAEIKVTLDDITWQKWAEGGFQQDNFRVKREDCHQLVVLGSPATLKNLAYKAKEISTMALSFNFLTDKVENTPYFDYHVIESFDNEQKTVLGGELYRIQKPARTLFSANGGDNKQISYQESVELSASSIGESAFYNWYDESGTLIYTGQDFTVTPDITSKYKLEVIAQSDGFTSYDSVIVHVKEYEIKELSPNPAVNQVVISYQAKKATSAYISIIQPYTTSSNNYLIDPALTNTTVDVSNLMPGSYFVRLICDGIVKDEKTLIVQ